MARENLTVTVPAAMDFVDTLERQGLINFAARLRR